jgi:siderophore synthetase component
MVRSYPAQLMQDPACRFIPMSALGTSLPGDPRHFFDEWLQYRQMSSDHSSVLALFDEVCDAFFEINLRMFQLGLLSEVHGQNTILVWRDGRVCGLVLRDHDSVRVHVPWLIRNGLADPEYRLKPGHANTLYHDTPEGLLFYLQTLAIHVNVRAIIEALALRNEIPAMTFWRALREALLRAIDRAELAPDVREVVHRSLFREARWPLKLLIRPMIERAGGPGSMPFGKGSIQNPFQQLGARV